MSSEVRQQIVFKSVFLVVLISTQTDVEYVVLKSTRVKPTSVHLNYDRKKEELGLFFPLKEVGLDTYFFNYIVLAAVTTFLKKRSKLFHFR